MAIVGMDTVEQVEENVRVAEAFAPLETQQERALLERALALVPEARKDLWWLPQERIAQILEHCTESLSALSDLRLLRKMRPAFACVCNSCVEVSRAVGDDSNRAPTNPRQLSCPRRRAARRACSATSGNCHSSILLQFISLILN